VPRYAVTRRRPKLLCMEGQLRGRARVACTVPFARGSDSPGVPRPECPDHAKATAPASRRPSARTRDRRSRRRGAHQLRRPELFRTRCPPGDCAAPPMAALSQHGVGVTRNVVRGSAKAAKQGSGVKSSATRRRWLIPVFGGEQRGLVVEREPLVRELRALTVPGLEVQAC
jgi:hypothetical protein